MVDLQVLIVARRPMDRAGLAGLAGPMAAGDCADWRAARARIAELDPDLALVAWEDLERARALMELIDGVVLVGDEPPPGALAALVREGLRGFLLADAGPEIVQSALAAAACGLVVLDPLLTEAMSAPEPPALEGPTEPLTPRELEVLDLLARGLSNPEIAGVLGISARTAKFHVGSLLSKLEAGGRTEAVTLAIRMGLIAL